MKEARADPIASVLFICLGNICRSPAAEGVFRRLVAQRGLEGRIHLDSAGTSAYHVGEPPDPRMRRAAAARGYDLSGQRARALTPADVAAFDYLIVMDEENAREVVRRFPEAAPKVRRLLEFAPETGRRDVPDPYYGGEQGFHDVLDLVEAGCQGLYEHLVARG